MDMTPGDRLTLTVSTPSWDRPRAFEIGPAGGWIGRDRGCEVAIDDADQFLSSRHARIDYAKGGFWLSDQSTNGTFLNGSAARMQIGDRRLLADGDIIRAGLFDISVAVRRSSPEPSDAAARQTPRIVAERGSDGGARWGGDPLSALGSGFRAGSAPDTANTAPSSHSDPLGSLISDLFDGGAAPAPPAPAANSAGNGRADRPMGGMSYAATANGGAVDPRDEYVLDRIAGFTASVLPGERRFEATAEQASTGVRPAGVATAGLPPSLAPQDQAADPTHNHALFDARPVSPQQSVVKRGDLSMEALAAFWHGLGVIPKSLGPDDLVAVMADFGAAFREATDHFASVLRTTAGEEEGARNPFAGGRSGLQRYFIGRPGNMLPLDEAVRDVFARVARRDRDYAAAVRSGTRRMAQSLAASSIESRFGAAIRSRRPRSRRAEFWHLFSAMENELVDLAEAVFQKELGERLRATTQRGAYRGTGGEDQ